MKRKFIDFWKDYAELSKRNWEWLKKHWIGYIMLIIVLWAVEMAWIFRDSIKDGIKGLFSTKLNKSVEEEGEEL